MTKLIADDAITDLLELANMYEGNKQLQDDVYTEILKQLDWANDDQISAMSTDEKESLIYANEQHGLTGFDCGWVYYNYNNHNYDGLIEYAKQLEKTQFSRGGKFNADFSDKYFVTVTDTVVKVEPRFGLLVQSTTIKGIELKYLKKYLDDSVYLSTKID